MEFKHIVKMFWIPLLWLIFICLPAFGSHHDHIITGQQHTMERLTMGNFPIDLMTASTSAVQKTNPPKMKTDDDRKTLSQQVADGKYGLIQKELFKNPISRPGVLSYESNSEVPKDTVTNLGGLNKSDIWLAENHLLVLKGGVFPLLETLPEYTKQAWPPIDDYDAPRRQVKLPKHPKVPPPFPVQLTDGGPIQILGTNFTRTLNDSFFSPPYAVPPLEGYDPGSGPFFPPQYPYPPNATSGETPFPTPPYPPAAEPNPQLPFPINGGLPPFFDSLPPGSAILPPPNNLTDQYDEDDLSIYYPPPYSFYYPKDNTTAVPPGPLVPGIVLPPPPDFFGALTKSPPATKATYTTETPRQTYPITTPLPTVTVMKETRKPEISKSKHVTTKPPTARIKPVYQTTSLPELIPGFIDKTQQPQRNKGINVTVLKPIKPTRKPPSVYIYDNKLSNKPFAEYGPPPSLKPQHRTKITITTTKVPLRAYFRTPTEIDANIVTRLPEKEQYTTKSSSQKHRAKPPTQIYYYDDTPLTNSISTPYPLVQQNRFINLTKEYYTEPDKDSRKYTSNHFVPIQPQYYYLPSKPYITQRPQNKIVQQTFAPNNFKSHIAKLQEKIQSYQRPPKQYKQNFYELPNHSQELPSSKPVYQYSFEVANYQEQREKLQMPIIQTNIQEQHQGKYRNLPQYSVQIEPALEITTTERPLYQNTPAPIYYHESFQANPQGQAQNFYTNNVPNYNYQDTQEYSPAVTPQQLNDNAFTVTPNPIYQTYYTKQDEQLFDDITKKYFTTFGKKLSTSTTPIPTIAAPLDSDQRQIIYSPPQQENVRIRTNRPSFISSAPLKSNILVNYANQSPTQNLQSEYVQLKQQSQPYSQVTKQVPQYVQHFQPETFPQSNENYRQSINYQQGENYRQNENYRHNENYRQSENYRKKIPQNNVNVQTIQAISIPSRGTIGEGKPGSFISYELPGDDGAHFYFLTPQLTQKDDRSDITYYYTQPSGSRIRRNSQIRST